jgi:phosphatidylglycerophosphatase A
MTDETRPNSGRSPEPRRLTPSVWIATGFGFGLISPAPGTAGALFEGLPLAWALTFLPSVGWQALTIAVLFGIGIPIATAAGRALGGKKDNQAIIWDEIATVPVVFLLVPLTNWRIGLLGFGLHRLFDITKLPPAAQLEALPDGLGVMIDDMAAAIYAAIVLFAINWLGQRAGWNLLAPMG